MFFSAGARSRVNGRTAKDTAWGTKEEDVGYTGANGRRASKGGTECDSPILQWPSTKGRGPTVCRTDTGPKRMQMKVRGGFVRRKSMRS